MAYQFVREPLLEEDADRLANGCESLEERLVVWTLLDSGLRVSELCSLTRENFLYQQRALRVKGKGGPYGKRTKVRVVPLSGRVFALLEHYFALHERWFMGPRAVQRMLKRVANRAGISKEVTPHILRHTWATLALQHDLSLAAVQRILGHERLSTTAIYLNLTEEHVLQEYHAKFGNRRATEKGWGAR